MIQMPDNGNIVNELQPVMPSSGQDVVTTTVESQHAHLDKEKIEARNESLLDNLSSEEQGQGTPPGTWKYPRINLWRYLAALFCYLMLGANDASIGVRAS